MSYRVAVLVSGSGSNLQALIDDAPGGGYEIALVLSDRADAYGLQRALHHGIACVHLPLRRHDRTAWEQRLTQVCAAFAPDLVVLAGFMRVLSAEFLQAFPGRVINQHPALLPADGGDMVTTRTGHTIPALRGAHVVADALRLGLPVSGCTVHRVTLVVDDGPLLASAEVVVLPGDDVASLHERIKTEERRLIVEVVRRLAREAR